MIFFSDGVSVARAPSILELRIPAIRFPDPVNGSPHRFLRPQAAGSAAAPFSFPESCRY